VETAPRRDERGSLTRLFCAEAFAAAVPEPALRPGEPFHHSPAAAPIRGLHFQRPPAAEWKLIRCLRGRVFDVAVDLREGSPTSPAGTRCCSRPTTSARS
jgi:dTDP-4-dehydrorhamnose 3,5-epimerase